jgi:hypothetical protein
MSLGLLGAIPLFSGGAKQIAFLSSPAAIIATQSTYTFAAQNIGAPSASRRIHVAIGGDGQSNALVSSVTVGGIAATINANVIQNSGTAAIATALVTAGTTADVVVTFAGNKARVVIGLYSSVGLASNVAFDSGSSLADPGVATLNTVSGGFCLAVAGNDQTAAINWTGGVVEDYENVGGGTMVSSGAHGATTGAPISPSADYVAAGADRAAVFATF